MLGVIRCLYQPSSQEPSPLSKGFTWPMPSWQSVKDSLVTVARVLDGQEVNAQEALEAARHVSAFSAYVWRAIYHLSESERREIYNGP